MAHAILRLPTVKARTGLSRTTIHRHVRQGLFPRPVKIGPRPIGWLESDIETWISQRIGQGDARVLLGDGHGR